MNHRDYEAYLRFISRCCRPQPDDIGPDEVILAIALIRWCHLAVARYFSPTR